MPTSAAACGFIIIARISRPRLEERIHIRTMVKSRIEETIAPILSEVMTTPRISTFQKPNRAGRLLERGPKYQSRAWLPIRLIASVAIMPRTVKFGLSWIGMKASAQTRSPPRARR